MKASQALALFDGKDFVLPEHIAELAVPVIAHRLVLDPQAKFAGTKVIVTRGVKAISGEACPPTSPSMISFFSRPGVSSG